MLIVASHAIVSSLLYHQNPSRFIASNVGPYPGTSDRENAEEKHVSQVSNCRLLVTIPCHNIIAFSDLGH